MIYTWRQNNITLFDPLAHLGLYLLVPSPQWPYSQVETVFRFGLNSDLPGCSGERVLPGKSGCPVYRGPTVVCWPDISGLDYITGVTRNTYRKISVSRVPTRISPRVDIARASNFGAITLQYPHHLKRDYMLFKKITRNRSIRVNNQSELVI
eukprot:sb/3473431/